MGLRHYFWDSCVFIAYLNDDSHAYDTASLATFISETQEKNGCRIYTSAIALAEITPKRLKNSSHASFQEFLRDFRGSIQVVESGPYVNINAGLLKDVSYKKGSSKSRVLTTGDAIMLATALEIEETYGVDLDAFHTFDNGHGKGNPEGKGVPLLDYHLWLEGVERTEVVNRVVALNRCKPIHDEPDMIG
tara:strand:+ start:13938 stop:14507 length:570 start_codon:yes stop_codon:yes gene_type:complete